MTEFEHPLESVLSEVAQALVQKYPSAQFQQTQRYTSFYRIILTHKPSEPTQISVGDLEHTVKYVWPHSSVLVTTGGNRDQPVEITVTLQTGSRRQWPRRLVGLFALSAGLLGLLL